VGNGIFLSEIGSRFGDMGGTPPPKISTDHKTSVPPRLHENLITLETVLNHSLEKEKEVCSVFRKLFKVLGKQQQGHD